LQLHVFSQAWGDTTFELELATEFGPIPLKVWAGETWPAVVPNLGGCGAMLAAYVGNSPALKNLFPEFFSEYPELD
jgi:hypothetical protein